MEFGNHGNKRNCIKVHFYTYKEGGNRTIEFGNHSNNKNYMKAFLMLMKKEVKKYRFLDNYLGQL